MPVYNLEDIVVDTLESIVQQAVDCDIEILVVDDSSTDDTAKVVKHFATLHENVKLLTNERRKGVSGARNTGIKHARGDWIAFLDGDDIWTPNSLARRIEALSKFPSADLISSGFYNWEFQTGTKTSSRKMPQLSNFLSGHEERYILIENIVESLIACPPLVHTSALLVRRKLVDIVGWFDEELTIGEDKDYWLRLALKSTILVYINEDLLLYRISRAGSLSSTMIPGHIGATTFIKRIMRDPRFKMYKKAIRRKLSEYELKNSYYYRKNKAYSRAIKSSISSIFHNKYDVRSWKSLIAGILGR